MAKKTVTKDMYICDFEHGELEIEAVGKAYPSDKDVCEQHEVAYLKEIRLPKEVDGDMSGHFVCLDPSYKTVEFVLKASKK